MARKIAILGGTGKMGQWFAKYFKDKGFNTLISGRFPEKSADVAQSLGIEYASSDINAVQEADIVLVSLPIQVTAAKIRKIVPSMKKNAILFDIASIKGDIIKALEDASKIGIRALSIHPLFGPGSPSVKGKRFLMIPILENLHVVNEMAKMFRDGGGLVEVVNSGETHDRMMALTLALPHFLNIVFGKVLSKWDIREVKKFAGTTFTLQLLLAESVLSEDPNLYYIIQSHNPAFEEILEYVSEIVNRGASFVTEQNQDDFVHNFTKIRASLSRDPAFSNSYNRFYQALKAIE
jgi:prephenate dehydrogenase